MAEWLIACKYIAIIAYGNYSQDISHLFYEDINHICVSIETFRLFKKELLQSQIERLGFPSLFLSPDLIHVIRHFPVCAFPRLKSFLTSPLLICAII